MAEVEKQNELPEEEVETAEVDVEVEAITSISQLAL